MVTLNIAVVCDNCMLLESRRETDKQGSRFWSIWYAFSPHRLPLSSPCYQENAILARLADSCLSIAFRHRSKEAFLNQGRKDQWQQSHILFSSPIFRSHQKKTNLQLSPVIIVWLLYFNIWFSVNLLNPNCLYRKPSWNVMFTCRFPLGYGASRSRTWQHIVIKTITQLNITHCYRTVQLENCCCPRWTSLNVLWHYSVTLAAKSSFLLISLDQDKSLAVESWSLKPCWR